MNKNYLLTICDLFWDFGLKNNSPFRGYYEKNNQPLSCKEENMFKVFIAAFLLCAQLSAHHLWNPKIMGKFSMAFAHRFFETGGVINFENELDKNFALGFMFGASYGKFFWFEICNPFNPWQCSNSDTNAALIDFGIYLKPQLPLRIGDHMLIPYLALTVGLPSISVINSKAALTQFYSAAVGIDFPFSSHFFAIFETGVLTHLRFIWPHFMVFPFFMNMGIGYRF
jgi:hypothetical protein